MSTQAVNDVNSPGFSHVWKTLNVQADGFLEDDDNHYHWLYHNNQYFKGLETC